MGLGPDLGARVQELTGPDAIPTVTLTAAAGDLSQILISVAAGTQEQASSLDRRSTPPGLRGAPLQGNGTAPVSTSVVLTCWGPVGMHSACMWQPPWRTRQLLTSGGRDVGVRGGPSFICAIRYSPPRSQGPPWAPQPLVV